MADHCLTLTCPPILEEKLVDLLLEALPQAIFSSMPCFSHGIAGDALSTREQVAGRSSAVQVEVLLTASERDVLLQRLRAEFAGTSLRYRIARLEEEGGFV